MEKCRHCGENIVWVDSGYVHDHGMTFCIANTMAERKTEEGAQCEEKKEPSPNCGCSECKASVYYDYFCHKCTMVLDERETETIDYHEQSVKHICPYCSGSVFRIFTFLLRHGAEKG